MKIQKDRLFWAGCFAVALLLLDLVINWGDWAELLWFCPVAAAVVAIAFFRRSALLMTVCLILSVPTQLPWVWDFVMYLFGHGMGRTEDLAKCGLDMFWGSAVFHMSVIPLSLWGVWRLGFHPKALFPAFFGGAGLLTVSFLLTPPASNVNCVFFSCDTHFLPGGYFEHFIFRSIPMWAVIVPASYFCFRYLFRNRLYTEVKDANSA